MRIKIAFAAITLATLGTVACQAKGTVTTEQSACQVEASKVPPYSVTFEDGSGVTIPSGHEQMVGGTPCDKVLEAWDRDRRFAGYVDQGR